MAAITGGYGCSLDPDAIFNGSLLAELGVEVDPTASILVVVLDTRDRLIMISQTADYDGVGLLFEFSGDDAQGRERFTLYPGLQSRTGTKPPDWPPPNWSVKVLSDAFDDLMARRGRPLPARTA